MRLLDRTNATVSTKLRSDGWPSSCPFVGRRSTTTSQNHLVQEDFLVGALVCLDSFAEIGYVIYSESAVESVQNVSRDHKVSEGEHTYPTLP